MELNGLIAVAVTPGTIGHVLFLCQSKTQTLHSHSCVNKMVVGTCNLFERDMCTPAPQLRHQARHPENFLFFHSGTMARGKKGKKRAPKQPARKRKEVHKIRWNPKHTRINSSKSGQKMTWLQPVKCIKRENWVKGRSVDVLESM